MKIPARIMVCGTCKVPVVSKIDTSSDDPVACPKCGAWDRFEDARRIMYEHVAYRLCHAKEQDLAILDAKLGHRPRVDPNDANGPAFKWRVAV